MNKDDQNRIDDLVEKSKITLPPDLVQFTEALSNSLLPVSAFLKSIKNKEFHRLNFKGILFVFLLTHAEDIDEALKILDDVRLDVIKMDKFMNTGKLEKGA